MNYETTDTDSFYVNSDSESPKQANKIQEPVYSYTKRQIYTTTNTKR